MLTLPYVGLLTVVITQTGHPCIKNNPSVHSIQTVYNGDVIFNVKYNKEGGFFSGLLPPPAMHASKAGAIEGVVDN